MVRVLVSRIHTCGPESLPVKVIEIRKVSQRVMVDSGNYDGLRKHSTWRWGEPDRLG
jgi:hypothetical protein